MVARKIGAFGVPNTEILEGEQCGLIKDLWAGPISIFIFCAVVNQHSGTLISLHLFSQSLTNFVDGPFQKPEDVRPMPIAPTIAAHHGAPESNKNRNGRV
ncbi:hypothetical protein [Rhizobium sp. WYCCWR 11146]|uniref:hypothetical protein n=1 Tax=Rhizobium sp. WYCCWR 11146 TaxID=2749833 RepID=UPI0015E6D3B4|nr:hypothetical protein [Rhizobium sp. WYCCWR 11146]MBA1349002.1 hypothetical protein [Rhizobium sp. WYCCWR 11146]